METIKATVNKTHPKASAGYVLPLSKIRENQHFKCIQFDNVVFDDCEAGEVIDFFTNDSRTWKEIHFYNCSGPVNAIVTIVLELNIVESLVLTDTSRDPDEGLSPLLAVGLMLPINTSLTSLALYQTPSTNMAEAKCLAFGLGRNITLKAISLQDYVLRDVTTLMALAKGFETNKTLESVTLDLMNDPDATCLIQALTENPSLRNFSMFSASPDEAMANLLCSTQASIQSITFVSADFVRSPNLLETIQNYCSILTSLDLRACTIQDPIAVLLAWLLRKNSTPALEFLNLNDCKLTVTGAIAIASVLSTNSTLTKLELNNNDFGDRGAQALASVLGENSTLEHLALGGNDLTEACIHPFANALRQNSTLQVLDLSYNSLGDGVVQIFDALHHNSTLQDLDISGNEISDAGIVALVGSLNKCGLCTLKMCDNSIGLDGDRSIAEAMRANTTLRVLALTVRQYEYGEIGSPDILERLQLDILQENCHLECFTLCTLDHDAGSREEILHTLNWNRGGRNILQNLDFPLTLWPMVLERADSILYYRGEESVGEYGETSADSERPQLSVLYSLLRGAPWLFSRPRPGTQH